MSAVSVFLGYVETQDGAPYVWQSKADKLWTPEGLRKHAFGRDCFDCSGLVTCGIFEAGGPDWRATHNADSLWKKLEPTKTPEAGDLAFYGMEGHSTHVEILMADGRLFGAIGGSRHSVVPRPEKARVRYRLTARPDLIGYRVNPLRESK